MYMNIHKTGFSAVFHISVMIYKLAHLIHLDLDHQNVFRQFHILFYQNQINSFIRYPSIRYPSIRYPSIRYPSIRYPSIRYPSIGIRLSGIRLSGSVYPVSVYPVSVYPVSVYPVSGTRLFYHASCMHMFYQNSNQFTT